MENINKTLLLIDGQNTSICKECMEKYNDVIIYDSKINVTGDNITNVCLTSPIPSFEDLRILTDAIRLHKEYDLVDILSNDGLFRTALEGLHHTINNIRVITIHSDDLKAIEPKTYEEKVLYLLVNNTKIRGNRAKIYLKCLNQRTKSEGKVSKIYNMFLLIKNEIVVSESTIDSMLSNIDKLRIDFTLPKLKTILSEKEFISEFVSY